MPVELQGLKLDYDLAKHLYDRGELVLYVDRGLAISACSSGLAMGPEGYASFILPGAVVSFPLVWWFSGFGWALLCIPAGILGFRLARAAAVIAVRRQALASRQLYEALIGCGVIWFKVPRRQPSP